MALQGVRVFINHYLQTVVFRMASNQTFINSISKLLLRLFFSLSAILDGYTYERAAIMSWIKSGKGTSPMTNSLLLNDSLTPNRSLKMLIQRN